MNWLELVSWIGVFFMGCYAGIKYESSRVESTAAKGLLLYYRGKAYKIEKVAVDPDKENVH